jgi:ribokinase
VRRVDGATGVALILVDAAGANVIAVIPGANAAVAPADAAALVFAPDDVLLVQLETPAYSIAAAARRARDAGALVLLNFAPFRPEALHLLPLATHVIVNESECARMATALAVEASDEAAQAVALSARFGSIFVVTLGAAGAIACEAGKSVRVPALAVTPIDTVGAGDAFCGYLAAALVERLPLEPALSLAAAAGSLACTKPGAQPSIPLRREVETALSHRTARRAE